MEERTGVSRGDKLSQLKDRCSITQDRQQQTSQVENKQVPTIAKIREPSAVPYLTFQKSTIYLRNVSCKAGSSQLFKGKIQET